MSRSHTPNSRHAGQSIIRSATGIVATAAIVGTGSLAFFVSHAYAGKTATTTTPATQTPGAISQSPSGYGDDGYTSPQNGYQSPYQDPYAQQGSQGGYAPQPSYGSSPQATSGGS